eukprot:Unigene13213_Nuclearia_a/m.40019 Unigene13213_Nuclearia_a/g.40019  ORF Unigene13213_Nuclearia_a/g.40019 Unigene13213_Nuclearia_a/m.40019 type:complete len:388 (-) Unigene13213_Nuclearia_a:15-1178(-)
MLRSCLVLGCGCCAVARASRNSASGRACVGRAKRPRLRPASAATGRAQARRPAPVQCRQLLKHRRALGGGVRRRPVRHPEAAQPHVLRRMRRQPALCVRVPPLVCALKISSAFGTVTGCFDMAPLYARQQPRQVRRTAAADRVEREARCAPPALLHQLCAVRESRARGGARAHTLTMLGVTASSSSVTTALAPSAVSSRTSTSSPDLCVRIFVSAPRAHRTQSHRFRTTFIVCRPRARASCTTDRPTPLLAAFWITTLPGSRRSKSCARTGQRQPARPCPCTVRPHLEHAVRRARVDAHGGRKLGRDVGRERLEVLGAEHGVRAPRACPCGRFGSWCPARSSCAPACDGMTHWPGRSVVTPLPTCATRPKPSLPPWRRMSARVCREA